MICQWLVGAAVLVQLSGFPPAAYHEVHWSDGELVAELGPIETEVVAGCDERMRWIGATAYGQDGEALLSGASVPIACYLRSPDLDGDGTVGGTDFGVLISQWGRSGDLAADLNGDGTVGGHDFGLLARVWGCAEVGQGP